MDAYRAQLESFDPDVANTIAGEERRQFDGVEMIPSENYTYPEVLAALGSVLTNKYSEGYPGRRYYGGQQYTDAVENIARDRACALFRATLAVHKIGRPPSLGRRRTSTRNEGTPRLNEFELVKREGSFASRMTLPSRTAVRRSHQSSSAIRLRRPRSCAMRNNQRSLRSRRREASSPRSKVRGRLPPPMSR